jgi:hypothetical protein
MHSLSAIRHAAIAVVAALVLGALSACGQSSSESSYEFSTSTPDIEMGSAMVDVRIARAADDKPVENAVIFETRFDMEPDGMGEMTSTVAAQGSPEPGTYRFEVKPTMAGRWKLTLSAKVQGEADTVRGAVVVTAR